MQQLLANDRTLIRHIIRELNARAGQKNIYQDQSVDPAAAAGVLLLLDHESIKITIVQSPVSF